MSEGDVIDGIPGILVKFGLATPMSRAFVAASLTGVAAYAVGFPRGAFDEDGEMRPFRRLSKSPHATYSHFLLVPVVAGTAAYLFT